LTINIVNFLAWCWLSSLVQINYKITMKSHTLKFWKNPKQKFVKTFTDLELLLKTLQIYKSNNFYVSITLNKK